MGIHKSQHTLMSHDNRGKKKTANGTVILLKLTMFMVKIGQNNYYLLGFFFMSEIMQLEIFNRQPEPRPFVTSDGLIVLLAEIKN